MIQVRQDYIGVLYFETNFQQEFYSIDFNRREGRQSGCLKYFTIYIRTCPTVPNQFKMMRKTNA